MLVKKKNISHDRILRNKHARIINYSYSSQFVCVNKNGQQHINKLEIRSVEHGICPIAEFTSPYLSCAGILAIRP